MIKWLRNFIANRTSSNWEIVLRGEGHRRGAGITWYIERNKERATMTDGFSHWDVDPVHIRTRVGIHK